MTEGYSSGPVLLQNLGWSNTNPPFWTFEERTQKVLQQQRDLLVVAKLHSVPQASSPQSFNPPWSTHSCSLHCHLHGNISMRHHPLSAWALGSHRTVPPLEGVYDEECGRHRVPNPHRGPSLVAHQGRLQASWSLALRCSSDSPVSSMCSRESACCRESSSRLRLGSVFCSGYTQGLYPGSCLRFHSGYFSPAL